MLTPGRRGCRGQEVNCTMEPATKSRSPLPCSPTSWNSRHFRNLWDPVSVLLSAVWNVSSLPFFSPYTSTAAPPPHPHPHLPFAEQPSPGQLLIRGRNDRCFAHQHCHLFRLSANSRCAVHIYFRGRRGSNKHTRVRTFFKKRGGGEHTCKHTSKSLSCPLQAASTTVTQDPDLNVPDLAPLVFECLQLIVSEGHRAALRQQLSEKKITVIAVCIRFFKNLMVSRGSRALGYKYSVPHDLDSIT